MKILLTEKRPNYWYNASIEGKPHLQASGKSKEEALGNLLLLLPGIEIRDICGGKHDTIFSGNQNPRIHEANLCHQ